jgi:diguanylate cyclase (GGDEF)-like protein/PAS domain S-box-containing protein
VQDIDRDIPQMKEPVEEARIFSSFYRALSEATRILHQPSDHISPQEILSELTKSLSDILFPSFFCIGQIPSGATDVEILSAAGPFLEWMNGVILSSDPQKPGGKGPAGEAIRTSLPQAWLLSDPRTPDEMKKRGQEFHVAGNLAVTSSRRDGETILLLAYFNDESMISPATAELFLRIADEVSGLLDRKKDRLIAIGLEQARETQRIVLKEFLSAKTEEEIYRILSSVVSRGTKALAVEVLLPGEDCFIRYSIEGPLAEAIQTLPPPPFSVPQGSSRIPTPTRIWDLKKPLLFKNLPNDPDLPGYFQIEPFRDIEVVAGFPLNGRSPEDPLLGVFLILGQKRNGLDDPMVFESIADTADIAARSIVRLRTEKKLDSVTRLYKSLTAIHALVLRKPGERELFSETVNTLIDHSGFIASGFYFPDENNQYLDLEVYKIIDPSGLTGRHPTRFSLDPNSPDIRTVTVRAYITGTPVIENDLINAYKKVGLLPRGETYDSLAFRSVGIFPVFRNNRCIGVFAVVSAEKDFFSSDISKLLKEVADIISLTLDAIETEQKQIQAEQRLMRKTALYNALQKLSSLAASNTNEENLLKGSCSIFMGQPNITSVIVWSVDREANGIRPRFFEANNPELIGKICSMLFLSADKSQPQFRYPILEVTLQNGLTGVANNLPKMAEEIGEPHSLDAVLRMDVHSAITVPIRREGKITYILNVNIGIPDYFDEDLVSLAHEAGEILTGALDSIDTEMKRIEAEQRLTTLIENIPEAIIFKDGEGRWKSVNQAGLRMFGLEGNHLWNDRTNKELAILQPDLASVFNDCEISDNAAWKNLGASNTVETLDDKKGNVIILEVTKIPLFSPDGSRKGLVISAQNITQRKKNEIRIEHMATHDPLTDLPNRRVFLDRIEQTLIRYQETKESFAVGILDLDGFNEVNNRLGHPMGDELLIHVGKRIESLLRKDDTLVRLGGDEFGLILTGLKTEKSDQEIFGKIIEALLKPFTLGDQSSEPVRISGSLGLAVTPPEHDGVTALIAHADLALYSVKHQGKNGWAIFEQVMEETLIEEHRIRSEFSRAIENKELCLYYQPQVNMEKGIILGVESLLRWKHPKKGLLLPESFIKVIEKSDLIIPLGRWVLKTAIRQQDEWRQQGINLRISINIGARHFLSGDFIGTLADVIGSADSSIRPEIGIEVTETEALRDLAHAEEQIRLCRKLGVSVGLDDFGTGQASLTSLQQLDVREVKIDVGFVQKMMESPKDLAIVSTLSTAAHMMLINVIAEGVETEEEGKTLIALGCPVAQGFGIAPPMAHEEIPEWISKWRPFDSWTQLSQRKDSSPMEGALVLVIDHSLAAFQKGVLTTLDSMEAPREEWINSHACLPGQWIDNAGKSQFRNLPLFEEFKRIHEELHHQARTAFMARDRNDVQTLWNLKIGLEKNTNTLRELLKNLQSG